MTRPLVVEFTKMQGTGNDFLVLDNRWYRFSEDELSTLAATWCRRHYGVGGDGLLALNEPDTEEADYRMHYVNADGSRATMCGNGARCLARFAQRAGIDGSELAFDTDAGLYRATVTDPESDLVRLYVPPLGDCESDVVLDGSVPEQIDALHYIHAGTEHLVAFVDDTEGVPVEECGKQLREDAALRPTGANVNFVHVDAEGGLHVRTYEKGVEGETLSCGTGVLAAAALAETTGRGGHNPATVHTQGGTLWVGTAATERGQERFLEGSAVAVFRGSLEVQATQL